MALEFMDSFSHSGSGGSQILPSRKWTGYSQCTYSSSPVRRVGQTSLAVTGSVGKTLAYKGTRIIGCAIYLGSGINNASHMISFGSCGSELCFISMENDKTLSIYVGSTNTVIWNSGSIHLVISLDTYHYYEVMVTLGGGTPITVSVSVRVDGVAWVTNQVGSTSINASGTLINAALMNDLSINGPSGGSFTLNVCDFIVMNSDATDINGNGTSLNQFIGDVAIDALIPIADQTINWSLNPGGSPNSYSLVNEIPPDDDVTYVYTAGINNLDTFEFQQLIGFGGSILGAQLLLYAKKDAEGTRTIAGIVGTTPVKNLFGLSSALYDYYNYFTYPLDSDNGSPWTPSVYNAERFGIKLIA